MNNTLRFGITAILIACASSALRADDRLLGSWKLISIQSLVENDPPRNDFGDNPKGYLVLTPEGRLTALITSNARKFGMNDTERAALHRSMIAYSGTYRVSGSEFTTKVDVSWIESWNGTEQKRHFRFVDGKLFLETAPQPSPRFGGKMTVSRLVWERDKSAKE